MTELTAPELSSILFGTELSGNENAAYRISYAVGNDILNIEQGGNNSGFTFGIIQLDIGTNGSAQSAYRQILDGALADGVIDQSRYSELLAYSGRSRYDLSDDLSDRYLADQEFLTDVIFSRPEARGPVDAYTLVDLTERVQPTVNRFLSEMDSAWGENSIFDRDYEGFHDAVAAIVSVVNRTNSPLTQSIQYFLDNQPTDLSVVRSWFDDLIVPTFGAINPSDWNLILTGGQTFRDFDSQSDSTLDIEDGPAQTATGALLDESGSGTGIVELQAPTFVGDGDAEFTISLSGFGSGVQYNIAYIIDVSGSMSGQRISDARNAYIELTNQLRDLGIADVANFAVIPFNSSSTLIDNLAADEAIAQLSSLSAGGGTSFGPALSNAQSFFSSANTGQTNVAYFLSDGQGSGASDALTNFANVQAFGIGAGANLSALNIIDTDNAASLSSSAQLVDVLTGSSVDVTNIDRIDISVDGVLVQSIAPSQLVDGPLGLQFTGSVSGLDVSAGALNDLSATVYLSDGSVGGEVNLSISSALNETSVSTSDDTATVRFGAFNLNFDADASGSEVLNLIANDLDNEITAINTGGTFNLAGGNDYLVSNQTANSTIDRVIDGGDGFDIVEYLQDYFSGFVEEVGGFLRIGTNSDTVSNVEEIHFANGILDVDTFEFVEFANKISGTSGRDNLIGTVDNDVFIFNGGFGDVGRGNGGNDVFDLSVNAANGVVDNTRIVDWTDDMLLGVSLEDVNLETVRSSSTALRFTYGDDNDVLTITGNVAGGIESIFEIYEVA